MTKDIASKVFKKSEWLDAYSWQCQKVDEGYTLIASTYANGKIVKIASKSHITSKEQAAISQKLLTSI